MNKIARFFIYVFICLITLFAVLPSCLVQNPNKITNIVDTVKESPQANKVEVDTEYYSMVEKPASFQNGDLVSFCSTFLKKNTKYPIPALKKKQQGTVIIQFGVDCFGSLKIFSVLKSSGVKILDDEALRVLKLSPKWSPAKLGNKLVGQIFMLQIKFNARTRSVEIK